MKTPISGGWKLILVTAITLVPSFITMCLSVIFDWRRAAEVSAVIASAELLLILMTFAYMYVPRWTESFNKRLVGWLS